VLTANIRAARPPAAEAQAEAEAEGEVGEDDTRHIGERTATDASTHAAGKAGSNRFGVTLEPSLKDQICVIQVRVITVHPC
jgi:hypothetical protein